MGEPAVVESLACAASIVAASGEGLPASRLVSPVDEPAAPALPESGPVSPEMGEPDVVPDSPVVPVVAEEVPAVPDEDNPVPPYGMTLDPEVVSSDPLLAPDWPETLSEPLGETSAPDAPELGLDPELEHASIDMLINPVVASANVAMNLSRHARRGRIEIDRTLWLFI